MKKLGIKLISRKEKIIWELPAYIGRIIIGDFSEKIYIPVAYWSLADYKRQWQEGLERIKTETKSCLVATVQGYDTTVTLINWWPLYRRDNKIIVRNNLFVSNFLKKALKGQNFTPDNCYDFIPKMSNDKAVSTWIVEL